MFWAAFCWAYRTQLYTMDGDPDSDRKGVTANVVLATLQDALPEILEEGMFFIQDNAPVHKAHLVQEWLTNWAYENGVEVIDWPPYSPDLNPIENLWKLLKNAICDKFPELSDMPKNQNSLSRLENAAKECWMELRKEVLEAEIRSMPDRLQAVIAAKGWYTKY